MDKLSGIITKKFDTQSFGTFEKRKFWLEEVTNSERFPNTWELELWKADCSLLDNYKVGDYVICYIDIKGKIIPKGKDGEWVANSLKCWNFEKEGTLAKKIEK
jgi:hypothetical protein